jgi:7-cyano-7-deazaguanine synthase
MRTVVLLSGGLDSMVSLLLCLHQNHEIVLALTVDYGQKAAASEIRVSEKLCKRYDIKHRVVELPFMLEISSGLNRAGTNLTESVWVPNRNGLLVAIAACFAESLGAEQVLCGFNREEARNFPDNTREFVDAQNRALYFSTLNHVKVTSMVQHMDKEEIVRQGLKLGLDFRELWCCYESGNKQCGLCPSCQKDKEAFVKAGINVDEYFVY